MPSVFERLKALEEKVVEQQAELDAYKKKLQTTHDGMKYRLKAIRGAMTRALALDSGERWQLGPEYTRGSRLQIPGRPRRLRERMDTEKIPRSDISRIHIINVLSEEGITDGRRNGLPKSV